MQLFKNIQKLSKLFIQLAFFFFSLKTLIIWKWWSKNWRYCRENKIVLGFQTSFVISASISFSSETCSHCCPLQACGFWPSILLPLLGVMVFQCSLGFTSVSLENCLICCSFMELANCPICTSRFHYCSHGAHVGLQIVKSRASFLLKHALVSTTKVLIKAVC